MALPWLDPYILALVDSWYRSIPRKALSTDRWEGVKIISHRGERDDKNVIENCFEGFDPLPGKVFGLECDVRFSRDLVPMVFHDTDLYRVLGCRERLCDLDHATLKQRFPQIPSLRELVERYGGKIHLMLEFKAEARHDPDAQLRSVLRDLNGLKPQQDYHLLSLDIPTLNWLAPAFRSSLVSIARGNVRQMSEYALQSTCAAFTGHYALLRKSVNHAHHAVGQAVGVGFPDSLNALRFSVGQGAKWIFTNQALALQALLEREKSPSKA